MTEDEVESSLALSIVKSKMNTGEAKIDPDIVMEEKAKILEKTGYRGVYHVLGGLISPLDGIGPEELNMDSLSDRARSASELIIATDASIEGDTTALYISKILDSTKIKITRLARGLPVGGHLEYVDEATLTKSIDERVEIDSAL